MGKTYNIINYDLLRYQQNVQLYVFILIFFIFFFVIKYIKDSFACLFIIQLPKDLYNQIIIKSCIKMNQKYPKYKDAKLSN